jgi:putative transposase
VSAFTANAFTDELAGSHIQISMDGRGRAFDNVFIERLWRSVKYEDLYIKEYPTVPALEHGLRDYFHLYNHERPHQSLAYHTPADVHCAFRGGC